MVEETKKCKRRGCLKEYKESENIEGCCRYHPGKPKFHDTKKGWDCCNKLAYDWDEFQKIEGCATGQHTDVKEDTEFWKSQTVQNAKVGIEKANANAPVPKSIDQFNKEQQEKKQQDEPKQAEEKKPFVTANGKYKCTNKGCNKEYDANDTDAVCNYHSGAPVFHDIKKYWTCCNKETWDWDEFMKIPTCTQGKHVPKMV